MKGANTGKAICFSSEKTDNKTFSHEHVLTTWLLNGARHKNGRGLKGVTYYLTVNDGLAVITHQRRPSRWLLLSKSPKLMSKIDSPFHVITKQQRGVHLAPAQVEI
jgi:hypothetical protein